MSDAPATIGKNERGTEHGPELRPVLMHLHTPADPCEGVVVSTQRCTAAKSSGFVRHVAINVAGTKLAGAIVPGQSFGVLPPGVDARGQAHKLRLYSSASPSGGEDGSGTIIATTVKRTIDEHWESHRLFLGVASNYLCDLQVGDRVSLTGPSGKRFVLPANPEKHDYAFFATGTGIAPFRGMLLDLLRSGTQSRIVLVMGSAYATDLLYHPELLDLASRHRNFTYLRAISRERQADGGPPMYVQDCLKRDAGVLGPLLASPRGLVYICGLSGMELGVFRGIAETLGPEASEQYVRVEPGPRSDPGKWERSMIHREIRPTRRVFMEVY